MAWILSPLAFLAAVSAFAVLGRAADVAVADSLASCAELTSSGSVDERALLCQIAESTQLLAHLGVLVNEGLERLLQVNGLTAATEAEEGGVEKRKHEYLRFGKRKHEYLRFGKRKHEYLRFGRK